MQTRLRTVRTQPPSLNSSKSLRIGNEQVFEALNNWLHSEIFKILHIKHHRLGMDTHTRVRALHPLSPES